MSIDQTELNRFLRDLPPFDLLTDAERLSALRHLDSVYINAQNHEALLDKGPAALYIVRTGIIDLLDAQGEVSARLEAGDLLGQAYALGKALTLPRRVIQQDGVLYRLPAKELKRLVQSNRAFAAQLAPDGTQVLRPQDSSTPLEIAEDWTRIPIDSLLNRALVSVNVTASIHEVASIMSQAGVSCVPVVDQGKLAGLITDRDLRNRVLAKGLDGNAMASDVMSRSPFTISSRQYLFDALALISAHNIHHLPVLDDQGEPVGMLTTTDLLHQQRNAPMLFMKALHKADSREALVALARDLPAHIRSFASQAKDAATAGRLVATLTDTLTRRLIALWEQDHGEPPVAWAWLAFGSQAREDQTLYSDQDNGLLLADEASDEQVDWFLRMAEFVCTGLDACGVPLCPGDVMAMNPQWCLREADWQRAFSHWVDEPTPKGVMHCMIFFDSRCIAGHAGLYRRHRQTAADLGQTPRFLAQAAAHVDAISVPLGLFDRLLGRDQSTLDIKTQGIAVINDIVRLHTLRHGLQVPGTLARLEALADSPHMAASDLREWADAWRFMTALRLRWQLQEDVDPEAPNRLITARLSNLERRQLKLALQVLKESQRGAVQTFRMGY